MRILHVSETFYPSTGGGQRHIMDLCSNLISDGHTSDVLTLNRTVSGGDKLPARDRINGISIYRIPFLNLKYYKISRPFFKRLKGYDVIHIHSIGFFSDFLVLTKFLHKKPLVVTTHGGFFHTRKIMPVKRLYFNLWLRMVLRFVNKVIAVSRNDQKLFSRIATNIVFIPNAVEMRKHLRTERKPVKGRFLTVGRISSNKRIDRLIDVFAFLRDTKLVVVGKDLEGIKKHLVEKARRMGIEKSILFRGEVSEKELLRLLKSAEFFLSASEYEGFGISVLEAMASGVPVIVNDIDAFHNFIENGSNGFIVDYSNPKEVADLILSLKDRELSVSANARKTAKQYDWKIIVKKIEKVYRGVL